MTATIYNDTKQVQDWCYSQGINKYPTWLLAQIYYLDCEVTEEAFPSEIELEVKVRGEQTTNHPYGSTFERETHRAEVIEVRYKDRVVDCPDWLESLILEKELV